MGTDGQMSPMSKMPSPEEVADVICAIIRAASQPDDERQSALLMFRDVEKLVGRWTDLGNVIGVDTGGRNLLPGHQIYAAASAVLSVLLRKHKKAKIDRQGICQVIQERFCLDITDALGRALGDSDGVMAGWAIGKGPAQLSDEIMAQVASNEEPDMRGRGSKIIRGIRNNYQKAKKVIEEDEKGRNNENDVPQGAAGFDDAYMAKLNQAHSVVFGFEQDFSQPKEDSREKRRKLTASFVHRLCYRLGMSKALHDEICNQALCLNYLSRKGWLETSNASVISKLKAGLLKTV